MKKLRFLLLLILCFMVLPKNVYADQYPNGGTIMSQIAVVGEEIKYALDGYAGIGGDGSSNLDGKITYDPEVFEFVEVVDVHYQIGGATGKLDKKVWTAK